MTDTKIPKYTIRRSRRAKNLLLRVDMSGEVELVLPWHVSFRRGKRFVIEQAEWLERALKRRARQRLVIPKRRLVTGEKLPVFGQEYKLVVNKEPQRKRTWYGEANRKVQVKVHSQEQVRPTLVRWYRRKAKDYFYAKAQDYGIRLGVHVKNVVVSNARSQWGSCMGEDRRVSLQWRLALAPRAVADYVVAHEVAHLKVAGHNISFWRLVAKIDREYEEHRNWLRKRGHILVL